MSTLQESKVSIAENFVNNFKDDLDTDVLNNAQAQIKALANKYPASGSVASFIFYLRFNVTLKENNGKTFTGNAGGVTTPGGGALIGDVYTNDLNALYSNTHSFAFTASSVYTALYFFDENHHLLGTFQAGAVSTVNGKGGGRGSWS